MTVRRRRILALAAAAPIAFTLVGASASVASADSHKAEHNKHFAPAAAASPTASAVNPYASSGVGSGTPQGNGHAPCNGCVGKADNKNPPGQAPNGSDHNKGYECDGNHGVGDKGGNPAHSGCSTTRPTTPPPSTSPPVSPPPSTKSPSPSPSATPPHTISGSPSAPAVCTNGPCYHPPVCQTQCLPYTGMNVGRTAAIGGEGVLAGVMILLLANLQTQVKKYRSMPVR